MALVDSRLDKTVTPAAPYRGPFLPSQPLTRTIDPARDEHRQFETIFRCLLQQLELTSRDCPPSIKDRIKKPLDAATQSFKTICRTIALNEVAPPTPTEIQGWINDCDRSSAELTTFIAAIQAYLAQDEEATLPETGALEDATKCAARLIGSIKERSPLLESELEALRDQVENQAQCLEAQQHSAALMRRLQELFTPSFLQQLFSAESGPKLEDLRSLRSSVGLVYSLLWTRLQIVEHINPIAERLMQALKMSSDPQPLDTLRDENQKLLGMKFPYVIKYKGEGNQLQIINTTKEQLYAGQQHSGFDPLSTQLSRQRDEIANLKAPVSTALRTLESLAKSLRNYAITQDSVSAETQSKISTERDILIKTIEVLLTQVRQTWNKLCLNTYFASERLNIYRTTAKVSTELNLLHGDIASVHQDLRAVRKSQKPRGYHEEQFSAKMDDCTRLAASFERASKTREKEILELGSHVDRLRKVANDPAITVFKPKSIYLADTHVELRSAPYDEITRITGEVNSHTLSLATSIEEMRAKLVAQAEHLNHLTTALQSEHLRIHSTLEEWTEAKIAATGNNVYLNDFSQAYMSETTYTLSQYALRVSNMFAGGVELFNSLTGRACLTNKAPAADT